MTFCDKIYTTHPPLNASRDLWTAPNVRFNEKLVFGDKYRRDSIKNWVSAFDEVDKEKWFVKFDENPTKILDENQEAEGELPKKRGRKRKIKANLVNKCDKNLDETENLNADAYFALLTKINQDPASYREAMQRDE